MIDPNVQCHVRHIRAAGMCMSGAREWFKRHDMSWSEFLAEGRPSGDFVETGDPLALRMVEAAVKEADNGR